MTREGKRLCIQRSGEMVGKSITGDRCVGRLRQWEWGVKDGGGHSPEGATSPPRIKKETTAVAN